MKKLLLVVSATGFFFFAYAKDSTLIVGKINNGPITETKKLKQHAARNVSADNYTAPNHNVPASAAYFSILQALPGVNVAMESDISAVCVVSQEAEPYIIPEAGYSMNPYTGEAFRSVLDLEFWGGFGPMTFKHYEGQRLRSFFTMPLQRSYVSNLPESFRASVGGYSFKSANNSIWSPAGTAGGKLIKLETNYFLHTPEGYIYRFEEFFLPPTVPNCTGCFELTDICDTTKRQERCGSAPCFVQCYRYQLKDFIDPYQREFKVVYGNQNQMLAVYGGMVPIHNYSWGMRRFVEAGSLKATIASPEGKSYFFKSDGSGTWQPTYKGQGAELFQDGTNYTLQMADGFRYRFEEQPLSSEPLDCSVCSETSLSCPSCATQQQKPCFVQCYRYQLQEIEDPYKNKYKLTYTTDTDKKLTKIEDPTGRYFQLNYNTDKKLSTVQTSDGRSVTYNYNADGIFSGVDYGDQTAAVYNFNFTTTSATLHFKDPRFEGTTSNMKVTTNYCAVPFPFSYPVPVVEMKNGLNDNLMTSLDNRTVDKKVTYEMGGKKVNKIYNMPKPYLLKAYTDGVNSKTTYEYEQSEEGYLKKQTDVVGRSISYERTKYGSPTLIIYPATNGTESWVRDPETDLITKYTNRKGYETNFIRDPQKRWITEIQYVVDNSSETFNDPDAFGQPRFHKRRNGGEERFVYVNGILKSESFLDTGPDLELKALPYNITYDHYPNGLLKSIPNPRPGNFLTQFEYDNGAIKRGLLTKMTNPGGSYQDYKYDDFGNRTEFTNELRKTWKTDYDEFKRPKNAYTPISPRPPTVFTYGLPGGINGCCYTEAKPTLIALPTGRKTEVEYDVEWRKVRETEGLGTADAATTRFIRDRVGRPVWKIDPMGRGWYQEFDEMNRVVKEQDPLINITGYTYDNLDRINVITRDGGRKIVNHDYQDPTRTMTITVSSINDPRRYVELKKFDEEGNMEKFIDANGNVHDFKFDQLNHLRKRIYPAITVNGVNFLLDEKYQYDEAGNLNKYRNRAGNVRTFVYDERDRLKTANWTNVETPEPEVTYIYDDANRLTSIDNGNSKIIYEYNDANEIEHETQIINGAPHRKVNFTYNADGLRETLEYPSGYKVKYNYTFRNQIGSIDEVNEQKRLVTYKYDLNGNRKRKTLNNNTYEDYIFNAINQLVTIESKTGVPLTGRFAAAPDCASAERIDYGYDNLNRVKYIQRNLFKGDVFSYNALGFTTEVQYNVLNPDGNPSSPDSVVSYVWDSVGNPRSVTATVFNQTGGVPSVNSANATSTSSNTTFTYNTNSLSQIVEINGDELEYSFNGNLKMWAGWVLKYDAEDRLTSAVKQIDNLYTMQFYYDALDRCVKRTVDYNDKHKTTFYYYDGQQIIEEYDINGGIMARYTYGAEPGEPLVLVTASNTPYSIHTVYYHQDKNGSVTKLSDGQGRTIEEYDYDLHSGWPTILGASGASLISRFGNRFMFQGGEYVNEETNGIRAFQMYNFNGRMYSPDPYFARFLQANPRDVNSYLYANNSPQNDNNGEDDELNEELPGFGTSLIPVVGSALAMGVHLRHGNYWTGAGYALLAISDAFLVGTVVKALGKVGGKLALTTGSKIAGGKAVIAEAAAKEGAELASKQVADKALLEQFQKGAAKFLHPSLIQRNKAVGDAYRDYIADFFLSKGYSVSMEVSKWTPLGRRFIDVEVRQGSRILGGLEIKVGSSRYTRLQRAKDFWLRLDSGYIVNLMRSP